MPHLSLKMSTNLVPPTMIIFIFFTVILPNDLHMFIACQEDQCQPVSCSPSGPIIRFPFRLKEHQPERCGFPGFDLNCSPTNSVEFDLNITIHATNRNIPLSIALKVTIEHIDYAAQVLIVDVLNSSCLPARVTELISSPSKSSLFEMYSTYNPPLILPAYDRDRFVFDGYTLFNCSEKKESDFHGAQICPVHSYGRTVYPAVMSSLSITDQNVGTTSCTKMYNVSDLPGIYPELHWSEPDCGRCEAQGKHCRPSNNGRSNETECFQLPEQKKKKGLSRKVIITVSVVVGSFLTVTAISALCTVYILKKRKRNRIQQFMEDYKALSPTRYTYAELKRITDKFKHRLGRGGYGTVYRGTLSNEIPVAVKVLHNIKGSGEEFINEVRTIGKIHHVNVVRLIGYCADGYKRALVYELLENDSLEKYISSPHHRRKRLISWEKLHDIALGVAKGLDYLHQGCSQRILHFDIKPQNILLDHNLNPKVADFGLAKLCSKDKSIITMTAARGTIGYIAPEVFSRNFGRVSHKSDIYSFGMLLLNLVGGRKMFDNRGEDIESEIYFPEWIYNQLDKVADIAAEIEKEEDGDVVKRLIIVGLWCIQWYPVDRPSTKVVIRMLEGEDMPIMPPNPFAASKSEDPMDGAATASGSDMFMSAETSFLRSN